MGAVANAIDNKLRTRFAPTRLSIEDESSRHHGHSGYREGGESHFRVEIVSAAFEGKSRVARQRLVYAALKAELDAALLAWAVRPRPPKEKRRPFSPGAWGGTFEAAGKVPRYA